MTKRKSLEIVLLITAVTVWGWVPISIVGILISSFSSLSISELTLGSFLVGFLLQEIYMIGSFLAILSWGGFLYEDSKKRFLGLRKRITLGDFFLRGIFPFVLYILGISLLYYILEHFGISLPGLFGEQNSMTYIESLGGGQYTYIWLLVCVGLIAPLVEEIIRRGFVTKYLGVYWGMLGVTISALLFSLIHGEPGVVIDLFLMGMLLSYVFWKSGSLTRSLFLHVLFNSLAILLIM